MTHPPRTATGVAASLAASSVFAAMYYYASLLKPLDGQALYAWRMVYTVPLLALLLVLLGRWGDVTRILRRLRAEPQLLLVLPASAALLAVQLWLFMWAPLNGHALDVALGYFLLPLTLVVLGSVFHGERLTGWQKAACAMAVLGVANELLLTGRFAWPVLVVALGYPVYFSLRRRAGIANTGALWLDMAIALPFAIGILATAAPAATPTAIHGIPWTAWLVGLGLISTAGLVLLMTASQHLAIGLFGLLGYVEPLLLVLVSLVLGERIRPEQWPTYTAIGIAIALLAAEGVQSVTRARAR